MLVISLICSSVMVQYHGLGLLYQIRKTDRLGVTKLVAKLTKMPLKSPYAACHLIRMVWKLIKEEKTSDNKLSMRARVMLDVVVDIKNNRKREK